MTCQSQFSQKNQKTLLMQGTKVFWQLIGKLTAEGFEQEVDKSHKIGPDRGPEFRDGGIMQILFPSKEDIDNPAANVNQPSI